MLDLISHDQIIKLCAKSLRYYDDRLVDHGERVAYIAEKIAKNMEPGLFDHKVLIILAIFHDAGAFKTEEIDRMVEFETVNVKAHSIYGYLFLKYFTPIGILSQSILYHHTDSRKLDDIDPEVRRYAELLHLADRTDIAIENGYKKEKLSIALSHPQFNPTMVSALNTLLSTTTLYEDLRNGAAVDHISDVMLQLPISTEESAQYLRMLVYSIDFKSKYTVVHSVNTNAISNYLAKICGQSSEEIERINLAALIHDVGKIAIPESILESPNRLSDEQMVIMRKHVVYTGEIIADILPPEITNIAVRHHERLDGSGYPLGLKAEQLSISDRIIAVADLISALGDRRSYKASFSKENILHILNESAEKGQLDPYVVSMVNTHYDDMEITIQNTTAPILAIYEGIQKEFLQMTELIW